MTRPMTCRAVARAALLALSLAPAAALAQAELPDRRIAVGGEGEVSAAPDMATISLGVAATAPEARAAMDAMNAAADSLLARLTAEGVAPRDVQTGSLRLSQPRVFNDAVSGAGDFEAATDLDIRVRDLEALGPLLDALIDEGANRLNSIAFGLADPAPMIEAARRAAIADAQARATLYAEAAGLSLGPVLSITEGGSAAPRPESFARAAAMSDQGVPVAGGEITVSARVDMVLALQD